MAELNNHWQEVQDRLFAMEDKHIEEVLFIYKATLDEIRGVIGNIYTRFTENDELTISDMVQYNRLQTIEEQIVNIVNAMTGNVEQSVTTNLQQVFRESYMSTYYATNATTNVDLVPPPLNPAIVNAAIATPMTGIKLSDSLEVHRSETIRDIKKTITQGLVQGKTYRQMSKELTEQFNMKASKAETIVRTESGRVRMSARQIGMEELETKFADDDVGMMKMWISSKDKKTRPSHRKADSQKVPISGQFTVGGCKGSSPGNLVGPNSASENINCRCDIVTVFDDHELGDMFTRDDNGLSAVEPYKNYEDWSKSKGLK